MRSGRAPLDLRLPPDLIASAISAATPASVAGTYFRTVRSGRLIDLALPRPPARTNDKRFSVRGVMDGLYLASSMKTALLESWTIRQDFNVDVYSVRARLARMFDLRASPFRDVLAADCFGLAKPPSRGDRNYAATQHLAYAVWSAGFDGIIWDSDRYAGHAICVYDLGPGSRIASAKAVARALSLKEWLRDNP